MADIDDDTLQQLYSWVDSIPLSRPKRNISRDFSDAVLAAEVVHHFYPRMVDMHNYSQANSFRKKMYNWQTLNHKVLKRLGFQLSEVEMESVVSAKPGVIEDVLLRLQDSLARYKGRAGKKKTSPGSARGERVGGPTSVAAAAAAGAAAAAPRPSYHAAPEMHHHPDVAAPLPRTEEPLSSRGPSTDVGAYMDAAMHADAAGSGGGGLAAIDADVLAEKDQTILEYKETIQILELKIRKLEQLVRLKDSRIQTLTARLSAMQGKE